jgi:CarD family transcriptional regulator
VISLIKIANLEVDYLFRIGDEIVYPMHGAGVIEAIEENEILGEKKQYFVMKFTINQLQVMIPLEKMKQSSVRLAVDMRTMESILRLIHHGESDKSLSYKERYKVNMEKMKTGKTQEGAEVVRDLTRMNNEKALNSSEKVMLRNAKKYLISEMGLINGLTENEATDLLNYRIAN